MSSPREGQEMDENGIGAEEVEQHLIYIEAAFTSRTPEDRQRALMNGFLRFGGRFSQSIGYLAGRANFQGPFEELRAESRKILIRWLLGHRMTDQADEDDRRAQMAAMLLRAEDSGLERLAVMSIMALPENHPQRDTSLARQALLRFLDRSRNEEDADGQVLAIKDLLDHRFESTERSLELIEQGRRLLGQVSEAEFRHDFRLGMVGYYVEHAIEQRDEGNTDAQHEWAGRADEILDEMRAEDPDEFAAPESMNVHAAVMELRGDSSEAASAFASAVDKSDPRDRSYQQAAQIEARYRMESGDYERVIKILSPIVSSLEEKYLTAVEESAVQSAGKEFSEAVCSLAFAHAHSDQWDEAIKYLENGKSLRLRYRAALRQSRAGRRLLELESDLYALARGVPVESGEFDESVTADWLGGKISLQSKVLEAYRSERPRLPDGLLASASTDDIAKTLTEDEAVVIVAGVAGGGTLMPVICHGDQNLPGGRFIFGDWTPGRWAELLGGETENGWLYALGAPELKIDRRQALADLLAGVEEVLGKTLGGFLEERRVRRVTIIPHRWLNLVPFWALTSLEPYEVSIAASVAHFVRAGRAVGIESRKALVVADPTRDLPVSLVEADSVARRLPGLGLKTEKLEREQATEEAIVNCLSGASVFHFCGHGRSDFDNPDRSALLVHPDVSGLVQSGKYPFAHLVAAAENWRETGENERSADLPGVGRLSEHAPSLTGTIERRLEYGKRGTLWGQYRGGTLKRLAELWTAGDIFVQSPLDDCRLAFLSACEVGSGSMSVELDECAGLPAALQLAGVSTIIGSLWPVSDALTALYVDLFYAALADAPRPANIVAVVRDVNRRLRAMKKDEALASLDELRRQTSSPRARFVLEAYAARIKEGADSPFTHPYDWAAFYVTGAGTILFPEEV